MFQFSLTVINCYQNLPITHYRYLQKKKTAGTSRQNKISTDPKNHTLNHMHVILNLFCTVCHGSIHMEFKSTCRTTFSNDVHKLTFS